MGSYEQKVWSAIWKSRETVWYVVTPYFHGDDPIPYKIKVYARSTSGVIVPNISISNP
jgi:hypothetical protein